MKKIFTIVIILIIGVVGYQFFTGNKIDSSVIKDWTKNKVEQSIKDGSRLIDVRTVDEYKEGHAYRAINWPLKDIQDGKYPDVSKDKVIFVYCRSGVRAQQAKELLEKAGYNSVISLISLDNWIKMGGQVER